MPTETQTLGMQWGISLTWLFRAQPGNFRTNRLVVFPVTSIKRIHFLRSMSDPGAAACMRSLNLLAWPSEAPIVPEHDLNAVVVGKHERSLHVSRINRLDRMNDVVTRLSLTLKT